MKKVFFVVFALAFLVFSCDKDDPAPISVSPGELTFEAVPEEGQTLTITAQMAWTISGEENIPWITVDPLSGAGDTTVTVTVIESTSLVDRVAELMLAGEGFGPLTIRITQKGLAPDADITDKLTDPAFRTFCLSNYDTNGDGKLSATEAAAVNRPMNVTAKEIASLAGIEYFVGLTDIKCSDNKLTALDVSKNVKLRVLWCNRNQLSALNVSNNTELNELDFQQNLLTEADVSKNTTLTKLRCSDNQLSALDVALNANLVTLYCDNNPMKSLDVSTNSKLVDLSCGYIGMTTLDVSKNTGLDELSCPGNQLTTLIVSGNTELTALNCSGNVTLSLLDVSKNVKLTNLICGTNRLTSLDISQNTELTNLVCNNNKLTALNVAGNKQLASLNCSENKITALDLTANTELRTLFCNSNALGPELDISKNSKLTSFYGTQNGALTTIWVWQAFNIENPPLSFHKDDKALYQKR